jgi:hypothetical protein
MTAYRLVPVKRDWPPGPPHYRCPAPLLLDPKGTCPYHDPRPLGCVVCDTCRAELATAADRDQWLIAVNRGVLSLVKCPTCEGRVW